MTKEEDLHHVSRLKELFISRPHIFIGILLLSLIVIFLISTGNSPPESSSNPTEIGRIFIEKPNTTTPTTPLQNFNGNTKDLLPQRAEIDTEFRIAKEEPFDITNYYPQYQKEGLQHAGFQNGSKMVPFIVEGSSLTRGSIVILKFESSDNAKTYYNGLVTLIENEGGYKEMSTSGIDAICFALEGGDYMNGYYRNIHCYKNNVFFSTEIGTFMTSRLDNYKDWATIISKKF